MTTTPCPNDTNGDGDCGQVSCPYCGKHGRRFVRAEVLLTESEYREMRTKGSLTASGTVGEAIREAMHLPTNVTIGPYGFRGNPVLLTEAEYRADPR